MTFSKASKENESEKDQIEKVKMLKKRKCHTMPIHDKTVQILGWLLLIVGFLITAFILYLAIHHAINGEVVAYQDKHNIDVFMEFDKKSRAIDETILHSLDGRTFNGCEEKFCSIACLQADHIFNQIYETLLESACTSIDVLLIKKQQFPDGALTNAWIETDIKPIHEVILSSSNITLIQNEAFNSPTFSETFLLSWHNLNLQKVQSGALLGLHSLKYLNIDTKVPRLDRAFFQPIQTSLSHLKLNAALTIHKDQNIFGVSRLKVLEYADLSDNNFEAPISKKMFVSVPNLKYLHMTNANIEQIEEDAFEQFIGKLLFLNLAQNRLTTLGYDVLAPLLSANDRTFVSLAVNNFKCDCDIYPLVRTYTLFRNQFMDALYCKAPHYLYGTFINEVDLKQQGCSTTWMTTLIEEILEDDLPVTTTKSYNGAGLGTQSSESNENSDADSNLISSESADSREQSVFKMRCLRNFDSTSASDADIETKSLEAPFAPLATSSESFSSDSVERPHNLAYRFSGDEQSISIEWSSHHIQHNDNEDASVDFQFEPPRYRFDLELFPNRSVLVKIDDCSDATDAINIIWFSEEMEDFDVIHDGIRIDYNCIAYAQPYLVVIGLRENTTYTFCLMPRNAETVTPFNCLPLYVPKSQQNDNNMWISKDNKQFTVGMLCLIFMLSTFVGAVLAYFGIKAYPDLLEGSKNVLVVKKSEKTCYVSTICDSDCKPKSVPRKKSSLYEGSTQLTLSDGPSSTPPPPFCISVKNLERISSIKSSSTCFEESVASSIHCDEGEYEMPKPKCCEDNEIYGKRCVPNNYGMSPRSPPPLPKRNSTVTENINLVLNRFSKQL